MAGRGEKASPHRLLTQPKRRMLENYTRTVIVNFQCNKQTVRHKCSYSTQWTKEEEENNEQT